MRLKRCKRCGRDFWAPKTWNYLCPECGSAAKQETVMRPRTCRQCGAVFQGGPRAWYCPECRTERKRAQDRENKRTGKPARPIGSMDLCVRCGKEYTVNSGRQMYCPDCAKIVVREKERTRKKEYWAERKEQYADYKRAAADDSKVCVVCGKTFSARGPSVTCSEECARAHKSAQQLAADIKRGKRKPPDSRP